MTCSYYAKSSFAFTRAGRVPRDATSTCAYRYHGTAPSTSASCPFEIQKAPPLDAWHINSRRLLRRLVAFASLPPSTRALPLATSRRRRRAQAKKARPLGFCGAFAASSSPR